MKKTKDVLIFLVPILAVIGLFNLYNTAYFQGYKAKQDEVDLQKYIASCEARSL